MAKKSPRACLVPAWWTSAEIQTRTCGDGSHKHISRAEALNMIFWKEAEWVPLPSNPEKVLRMKRIAKALRDKSSKLGPYLAKCVRQKKAWALAMEADIQRNFEARENVDGDAAPYV